MSLVKIQRSPRRSESRGVKNCLRQKRTFLLGKAPKSNHHHQAYTYSRVSKRARTDDEKEQRRIERVLRNRQAAQSSRERKRQEVEKLEGEKSLIEQQNEHLKSQLLRVEHEKFQLTQQIAKMASEMEVFKHGSSVSASTTSSPQQGPSLSQHDQLIKQELDDYPFALPTPQQSLGAPSVKSFSSPSTATYSVSSTPASIGLGLEALTASPDMTQHPAAMLCDLQCQSMEACQASTQPTTRHEAAIRLYSANLLCLTVISAVYSQLIWPLRMIFVSLRMGSSLPPSMMTTPMVLPLIRWLTSTPTNLLPPSTPTASQPKTSPTTAMSTRRTASSKAPILCLRLLRRLLLSSPSLARPRRAATGRALRLKTSDALCRNRGSEEEARRIARATGKTSLGRCQIDERV